MRSQVGTVSDAGYYGIEELCFEVLPGRIRVAEALWGRNASQGTIRSEFAAHIKATAR